LEIVSRYGFAPFAWYRIVVGVLGLVAVYTLPPAPPRAAALPAHVAPAAIPGPAVVAGHS
ncbi:hypothetical protein J8J40_24990, partial [Mycobacterium tuberculosis]|nr:hypothetical protein [Mycobacterium tuberculosis]